MMQEEDIFAGIHLADDCLGDKLNMQQFTQTWQKTSSEGFDFVCLKGLQTMRTLGQNMAWLLKCIELDKQNVINRPDYEAVTFTSFPDGK